MAIGCKKNYSEVLARSRRFPHSAGALYVHVPLCRAKCRYCDFYSRPVEEGLGELIVEALMGELSQRRHWLASPLESIFVGGGTPTALKPGLLSKLLENIAGFSAPAGGSAEFSVEANPGTVDSDIAGVLAGAGVNRVSLGAQSFDAEQLKLLGRIHQPDQIGEAVELLRRAGIENIGLDLIYGIVGQSFESWLASLEAAIKLGLEHVSCYALSFEPGTPLCDDRSAGRVAEVDDETQREMYYLTIDRLAAAGFEHYEISNFAQPARRCRQNLTYWLNEEYLGIGPAACSYLAGERRKNIPDLTSYAESIRRSQVAPYESERITGRSLMAETLMLGLRLTEGVEIARFKKRFGMTPAEAFPKSFERYISLGAIEPTSSYVRLSHGGLFTADFVLADILAEA